MKHNGLRQATDSLRLKIMMSSNFQSPYFWFLLSLLLFQSGCSLFFGNIKPVEEKSTSYGILDLSVNSAEWVRVESNQEATESPQSGISDMAFQSKRTASIISISSACKSYENDRKE